MGLAPGQIIRPEPRPRLRASVFKTKNPIAESEVGSFKKNKKALPAGDKAFLRSFNPRHRRSEWQKRTAYLLGV